MSTGVVESETFVLGERKNNFHSYGCSDFFFLRAQFSHAENCLPHISHAPPYTPPFKPEGFPVTKTIFLNPSVKGVNIGRQWV